MCVAQKAAPPQLPHGFLVPAHNFLLPAGRAEERVGSLCGWIGLYMSSSATSACGLKHPFSLQTTCFVRSHGCLFRPCRHPCRLCPIRRPCRHFATCGACSCRTMSKRPVPPLPVPTPPLPCSKTDRMVAAIPRRSPPPPPMPRAHAASACAASRKPGPGPAGLATAVRAGDVLHDIDAQAGAVILRACRCPSQRCPPRHCPPSWRRRGRPPLRPSPSKSASSPATSPLRPASLWPSSSEPSPPAPPS